MVSYISDLIISSSDIDNFKKYFNLLKLVDTPLHEILMKVHSNLANKDFLMMDSRLLKIVNDYFQSMKIKPIAPESNEEDVSDDIPF